MNHLLKTNALLEEKEYTFYTCESAQASESGSGLDITLEVVVHVDSEVRKDL